MKIRIKFAVVVAGMTMIVATITQDIIMIIMGSGIFNAMLLLAILEEMKKKGGK